MWLLRQRHKKTIIANICPTCKIARISGKDILVFGVLHCRECMLEAWKPFKLEPLDVL